MIVKWCYYVWLSNIENCSTGWTESVGCALLQASMSHSKGGSENVCVKYDTGSALALASLDAVLQICNKV